MYGEIFLEKTTEMEAKMRIDGSSLASNPKLQIISKLQFSNDLNDFVWEVGFLVIGNCLVFGIWCLPRGG
jgi:hypothetical protein